MSGVEWSEFEYIDAFFPSRDILYLYCTTQSAALLVSQFCSYHKTNTTNPSSSLHRGPG
jgi:hypothetical protein